MHQACAKNNTDEGQRKILVSLILKCLNNSKQRCTYGAVGELLGKHPITVRHYLGKRRPEASWVVNRKTSMPTKYCLCQQHPDLKSKCRVISKGDELCQLMRDFQNSGEA